MLLAGDEFGRTQDGNNNAYCQDNEISWVNWDIKEKGDALIRFVQKLTKLRREFPILRRNRFLTGALDEELDIRDVTWINATGAEMSDEEWADEYHALLRHADRRAGAGDGDQAARLGCHGAADVQRLSRRGDSSRCPIAAWRAKAGIC